MRAWILGAIVCWLALLEAGAAEPCAPGDLLLVVGGAGGLTAKKFAKEVECTGGKFTVAWIGSVNVATTIPIGAGTTVIITGAGPGRSVVNWYGPVVSEDEQASSTSLSSSDRDTVEERYMFVVDSAAALTLTGLSLINERGAADDLGSNGGGVYVRTRAALTVEGCELSDLKVFREGGAIHASLGAKVTVFNSKFIRCKADVGGAIWARAGTVKCSSSTFEGCSAYSAGGAIHIQGQLADGKVSAYATMRLTSVNITECKSSNNGGGLSLNPGSNAQIALSIISDTTALFGGGISQKDSSWLSIRDSAFYRNAADGLEGGGAILTLGRVGGEGLIFEGNSGMNAGTISIYRPGAQVRLRDVQINGSSATQDGGAVLAVDGARFSCTKCVIDAASADGYGGALYGYAGSTVTLDDVTISGSSSSTLGGAIYSLGMLAVTSSTFLENSALRGGAIATEDSVSSTEAGTAPRTTIVDSTFRDNSAKLGGGALYLSSSTGLAQGNTFGGNTAQTGGAILLGTSVSTGFELTDGTFVNNAAVDGAGGAIVQEGHELLVDVSANTFKDSTSTCCYAPSSAKVDCHDVDAGLGTNLQCCGLGSYLAPTAKSDTTAFKCVNCDPATMSCTAGGLQLDSIPLQAGYWRQNLDSSKIQECFNRDACKGGAPDTASVTGATYCADGYQGPYCALCATGHTPVYGYTCASCDGTNAAVGIFGRVVIFLVLAAVVVWLIVGSGVEAALQEADAMAALPGGSKRRRTRRVLLKFAAYTVSMLSSLRVPLVVLQILTTYYLISGAPLPRVYSEFLHYMQFINLNWEWLLSFGCLIQVNFYDTLLLYTLTPMAVLAFLMTPRALLGAACTRRRLSPSLRKKLELFQMRDLRLLLIFTFVIFSSVSTQILQTFSCENFGSSESYLRADYSISCNTPAHQAYKIYAACMILVYPIGIPALYAVVLWHERRFVRQALAGGDAAPGVTAVLRPLSSAQMAEKLASSFLSEPYRDRVFFWEVVECGRRLMLTGLMVFITPNSPSQTAVACLLAFVTTFAYVSVHPHLRRLDRGLYILGTYTIFAAFLSTLLMLSEYTSSYSEDVVGVLLIMLNVTLIVVPPVVTALSIRASRKTSEPAASGTAVVVPVVTALPLAVDIVVAPKK